MTDSPLKSDERAQLPALPLRDVVVFPHMVIPLFVGRAKSIEALERASKGDKQLVLLAQKEAGEDEPQADGLYRVGTVAHILQLLKLPDDTVKVLVEGMQRVAVERFVETESCFVVEVQEPALEDIDEREQQVLVRNLHNLFEQYVNAGKKVPPEVLTAVSGITEPTHLADTISAHLNLALDQKQQLLECWNIGERLERLMALLETELDLIQVEKRMRGRVKRQMEKSQREYYLNEQMKAIQKELGDLEDGGGELEELERKIDDAGMPQEALDKTRAEFAKLKMMSPMAAEATVVRNYIDWMVQVPWKQKSRIRRDLHRAEAILEEDHYGLEKVKERILEYLAVQQRVRKLKGPILCLVGPPGVGKTSLGRSIARATNRKFVRMSLGGVRDEAEIRGHRRTYIGSLPGRIIQNLSRVGTRNPVFMLDEVDKMAMDFRGDPASALLEVLDPEQNSTFNDHYLEVDYDLSDVMFVATANTLNIPAPLLDRMEIIRISGYTEDEKLSISQRYLEPKTIRENGLRDKELNLEPEAVRRIIREYTREAGVRNLERELSKLSRKAVKEQLQNPGRGCIDITSETLDQYLGVPRYQHGRAEEADQVGLVTGLAWTEVGGELLTIEATVMPGKGNLTQTGQLGDVMQESIKAALTVVRSRSNALGIRRNFYTDCDFHLHVPEGATPKDGPSAGIGMCTALVSALTGIPGRADVAMTGEITLRGEVLPIGGLKEKLLAALRGGIRTVLIPQRNEKDLPEVPDNIKEGLDIRPVRWIDQVLEVALTRLPTPLPAEDAEQLGAEPASGEPPPAGGRLHH